MQNSYSTIFQDFSKIEEAVIFDLLENKLKLRQIPEPFITQKVALAAIITHKENFFELPLAAQSNLICLAICQLDKQNLLNIPPERSSWVNSQIKTPFLKLLHESDRSEFLCEVFIRMDHENIKYVPDAYTSNIEFLQKLSMINPRILTLLDESKITPELCTVAMQAKSFNLSCLPVHYRSKEICQKAFNKNYREIIHFPKEYLSRDIILAALEACIKDDVFAIFNLIEKESLDDKIIECAIIKDEKILSQIDYDLITEQLVFNISEYIHFPSTLNRVPESIYTENLAQRLVSCNPMLLLALPLEFRSKQLCLLAVSRNGLALEGVPQHVLGEEIYRTAVQNNGLSIKHVPTPYIDGSLPELAVAQNGEAIEYIPENCISEILCRKAVLQNPHSIYSIPDKMQTNELYTLALQSIPSVIKLIPVDKRTLEHCLLALREPDLIDYVPIQFRDNNLVKNLCKK